MNYQFLKAKKILFFATAVLSAVAAFFVALFFFGKTELEKQAEKTANYLMKNCEPVYGMEWLAEGLYANNGKYPGANEWLRKYKKSVEEKLDETNGILNEIAYTDYSRTALSLCNIGESPENFGGYSLITPLLDFEQTTYQGLNGAVFALRALDAVDAKNGNDANLAMRERYVDYILNMQAENGGFGIAKESSTVDMTAMTLTALANHRNREDVKETIDKALDFLSKIQNENGGFSDRGVQNSQSCAQVIIALCSLDIDVYTAPKFIKNSHTAVDNLMTFAKDGGGFSRTADGEAVPAATIQVFSALTLLLATE